MKQSLIDSGLSESSVNSYLAGRAAKEGYDKDGSLNDITQKEVTAIHESVGGEKAYKTCINTNNKLRANNKQFEKDIRESDRMLGECLDDKIAIEEQKEKIEESIKIFFRLNEKIIK